VGADDLYRGELAAAIADDMGNRGGLLTLADLTAYRAVVRPTLRCRTGEWDLGTNAPPSIGGPLLTVMLRELGRRGDWTLDDVLEIQRLAIGHRVRQLDFSTDLEADGYALLATVERHGLVGLPTSAATAHVSVVDGEGTACAITASSRYGSGATVPGTGLMLNNCLGEPELNQLGLHALTPGTRLASNMSPTVGRADARRALAVGSPGADRITTALMQVLGRHCFGGMHLVEAIGQPRLHVSFGDDGSPVVHLEDDPRARRRGSARRHRRRGPPAEVDVLRGRRGGIPAGGRLTGRGGRRAAGVGDRRQAEAHPQGRV
jgi:gamma-glutamyltranspeptidase/glutathione hydrolase